MTLNFCDGCDSEAMESISHIKEVRWGSHREHLVFQTRCCQDLHVLHIPACVCMSCYFICQSKSINSLYIVLDKFYGVLVIVAVGIGGVEDARSLDLWF